MTLVFDNFAAWSAQLAVLIAMGALAALTLAPGRARLMFWQGLLAIALLLPAFEPWTRPALAGAAAVSIATSGATVAHAAARGGFHFRREWILWIVLAGAALRGLWIGAGFLRLRRHRLAASRLIDPPVPFEGLGIRWYVSDTISGPVTFGFLHPAILLPANVCALAADLREAIACHELVHVRRRDWLFVVAEEAIRGLFWFHPAVWFALSQIQLAREQAVDAEVIGLMSNRERYLEALVSAAAFKVAHKFRDAAFGNDVAPAPLFLKKRQLARRVAAVLKETRMSKPRLLGSLATVSSAALLAARFAIWMFPLQALPVEAQAQNTVQVISRPSDGAGITVDAGGPLMHRTGVFRPANVTATGTVVLDAILNASGEVTDARVITGPEELRRYALESVLNWHYSIAQGAPPTVRVSISFGEPPPRKGAGRARVQAVGGPHTDTLKYIMFDGVAQDVQERVLAVLPIHEGDAISATSMDSILPAVRQVDEHFNAAFSVRAGETTLHLFIVPAGGVGMGTPGILVGGVQSGVAVGPRGGVPGSVQNGVSGGVAGDPQTIRVGGNVQQVNLLRRVQPAYPPLAKQARVQGVVHLTALIGKDGSVVNLEVNSGHPLLVPAALEAVKQWVYKPTLLNGNPVEVITTIDVSFSLSEDQ